MSTLSILSPKLMIKIVLSTQEVMDMDVKPSVITANCLTNSQMVHFTDFIFLGCLVVFLDSTDLKMFTVKYFLYS